MTLFGIALDHPLSTYLDIQITSTVRWVILTNVDNSKLSRAFFYHMS